MTTLVIHYGLPRCGSTTLQSFFSSNTNALKANGVDYPNFLGVDESQFAASDQGNAFPLCYSLLDNKRLTECHYPDFSVSDLISYLSSCPKDSVVLLSSEWFTSIKSDAIRHFAQEVSTAVSEVVLACVYRSLSSMALSRYSQRARYLPSSQSFSEFFSEWRRWVRPMDTIVDLQIAFGTSVSRHIMMDLSSSDRSPLGIRFVKKLLPIDDALLKHFTLQPSLNESVSHLALLIQQQMAVQGSPMTCSLLDSLNSLILHKFPSLSESALLSLPIGLQASVFSEIATYFQSRFSNVLQEDLDWASLFSFYTHSSLSGFYIHQEHLWLSSLQDLQDCLWSELVVRNSSYGSYVTAMSTSIDSLKILLSNA